MTKRQREALQRRVEMALLWANIDQSGTERYRLSLARAGARACLDELDHSFMDAAAARRAVASIIERIEASA